MFTHSVETSTPAILARDATVTLLLLIARESAECGYKRGSSSMALEQERGLKIIEAVEGTVRPRALPYDVSGSALPLIRTRLNTTTSGKRCETVLQAR